MKTRALLATIPSDSHSWNLVYIQQFLEELGIGVYNLGVCTPLKLIAETALSYQPDLLVISTINGMGKIEAPELAKEIRSYPALNSLLMVIGGKLSTNPSEDPLTASDLLTHGFDQVYTGDKAIAEFKDFLNFEYESSLGKGRFRHTEYYI